jgi:hypothetical protein
LPRRRIAAFPADPGTQHANEGDKLLLQLPIMVGGIAQGCVYRLIACAIDNPAYRWRASAGGP